MESEAQVRCPGRFRAKMTIALIACVSIAAMRQGAPASAAPAPPLPRPTLQSITAPLKVSASNPHYFVDSTGKAVLLAGSHTWNNFQDETSGTTLGATTLDYNAYVAFLVAHGHNCTIVWRRDLPTYNWSGGLGTTWTMGNWPYKRTGPGNATDGLLKFDLTQLDQTYFDRLRTRVQLLNQNQIYAIVRLWDGFGIDNFRTSGDGYYYSSANNINGIDDGGGSGADTMSGPNALTAIEDTYFKKVIDTVNDLPNVLFDMGDEDNTNTTTWFGPHVIDLVHTYEAGKPFQHPVIWPSLNVGTGTDTPLTNSNADGIAGKARIAPTSSCGSGTPTCKVNINDSDHTYFGMWNDSAQTNRQFIWQNVANGNSVLFMDPYIIYWPGGNRNLCHNPVNGVCDAPDTRWDSFRDNLGYAASYGKRMNLAAMTPQPGLASTGYALAHAASTGAEYLVYAPSGGSLTVNVSATAHSLNVEWLNPSTGLKTPAGTVTGGSSQQSFTPPFSGDAVLYLVDAGAGPAPPSAPVGLKITSK